MAASEEQSRGPVIKDRRRIDPETGQPRQTSAGADDPAEAGPTQASQAAAGTGPRAAGQPRPGKHAVSKPGGARAESAGSGSAEPDATDAVKADGSGTDESDADQEQPPDGAVKKAEPDLAVRLAERTADLQRVQAEYANYRKRVERDRVAVREQALASVLSELLPVLDDIGRAREHGELNGGFKAVAEALEASTAKLGLTTFGEAGEPFDPKVHEALLHSYSADVTEPTCVQLLQPGYQVGERILRPARVAVAEPTDPSGARTASEGRAAGHGNPRAEHGAGQADEADEADATDEASAAETDRGSDDSD